jgi:hypothetical protein
MRPKFIVGKFFRRRVFLGVLHNQRFAAWRCGVNRSVMFSFHKKFNRRTDVELALNPPFCQTAVIGRYHLKLVFASMPFLLRLDSH